MDLHMLAEYVTIHASTPSSSGGRGDFGCLLSKCCLNVLGSGIWDCKKQQEISPREETLTRLLFRGRPRTHLAHRAGEHQSCLGCSLLIVALGFLLLGLFFGVPLLRLNLLMPTCHFITICKKWTKHAENVTFTLHS